MAEISHASMKTSKKHTAPKPTGEVFVVENAESDILEANEIAQEEKVAEAIVVPDSPPESPNKKMFEDLVFIGCVTDVIEIHGHQFKISTLTHREQNDLMREIYKFGDTADLYTVRTMTLAQCLRSVDGIPFEQIDINGEFKSDYKKKFAMLDGMQNSLVEKLYDFYTKLDKAGEESIKDEEKEIKNS